MRGWLRHPRFFHSGRVINGPASNFETRQRLNQVGEYRARRPGADIPGRLCGGGLAETPAVESDRDGVKIRPLGVWHDQCPRYRNFHALQEVMDAHARRGTPRSQCFLSPRHAAAQGRRKCCRVCQISAKPWIPRIASVAKSICGSGEC